MSYTSIEVDAHLIPGLIDKVLGSTDWRSGTPAEIVASIEGAGDITLTGILSGTNVAATANAPGDNTASVALIGQKDSSVASKASLDIETEEVVEVVGTFTPSHKFSFWLNAVEYQIQMQAV
jgi:hypothetical protein